MKNLIKRILNEEVVDIADIQDELLVMPLDVRQKLSDDLKDVVGLNDVSELGEQISYKGIPEIKAKTTVGKLLKWVKRYITDKATNFLINASMDEIKQTISILDVMDPTSTVGIFNPKAMYLGGGIDFAKDAVSWRSTVEDFYGPNHIVDGSAGAGTFGEAQISALKNQQVFLWLTNDMKLSNVSPWLLPSVTKVLIGDEIWPFLGNFK